ncbi:7-cyano-7-deazaguanine synthase [Nitrosarchaeum sp. AC2]|uniref:7-cyano-7-deazaguanine synthase n=1 Tax=Nitrosarchaeum sp. AC2 TaxID=2259673 RepID=UPI0015CDFE87|nr:7-cyano-7-deazaguanine synthase [Nitrosarchaeum sp. AC2]QLH10263.1 hypothetical protein DSQ20_01140 [Nitrosarchaeum sp. AC2]
MNKYYSLTEMLPNLDDEIVVLWSGGLDSTGLIFLLLNKYPNSIIHPLFIKHGQKNMKYEEESVYIYSKIFSDKFPLRFNEPFVISTDIPAKEFKKINSKTRHYLRNSDLINNAVRFATYKNISIIILATFEDDFVDGTKEYLQIKNEEINKGTDEYFTLLSPFLEDNFFCHTKTELISICKANGLELNKTRSCYEDNPEPCNDCPSCKRRDIALSNSAGLFGN